MDGVNREQGDATPAAVKRTGEGGLGWTALVVEKRLCGL